MSKYTTQSGGRAPLETARARSARPSLMGFTIVELTVSLAIFLILSSVVLAKYRTFDTNAKFANAVEDVVLALRQAQVYGVGSKGNTTPCGTSSFECSYGVYFSTNASERNGITVFVDIDDDRKFTSGTDVAVERISWLNTISVDALSCPGYPGSCIDEIAVTFRRPNPDAFINDATANPPGSYAVASIILRDTITEKTGVVTVSNTGQISLQ